MGHQSKSVGVSRRRTRWTSDGLNGSHYICFVAECGQAEEQARNAEIEKSSNPGER